MYEKFYGFDESPFNITPDPRFLFFSEKHREAFNHLLFGLRERKGFIQITGEIGAGKTTLCRALLQQLDDDAYRTALVLNPRMNNTQLLRTILREFHLDADGTDRVALLERLNGFLLEEFEADRDVVLVCVKSAQTEEVGAELDGIAREDTVIASLQNGVRNADVLRGKLGKREVMGGIVGFNVVSRGEGLFHRGISGPLMLETPRSVMARALTDALGASGLEVQLRDDLAPDQWTKLMINLNNAVSALSGAPTRELLLSPIYRRIISAIIVVFILVFTDFGVPKVIGGNFNVLATDIYKEVIGQQNFGMGAVVSVILLIPAVIALSTSIVFVATRALSPTSRRTSPPAPQT